MKNREKELIKNTTIITFGRVCTHLITFLLLPLYTGILTTDEYGTVDLLNTLTSLLVPIITVCMEQAIFRFLLDARDSLDKQYKIVTTGIISVVFQVLLSCLVFLFSQKYINNVFKGYLLVNVVAFIFSSLLLQIARGLGNNNSYAIASFLTAFFTVSSNVVMLLLLKLRVEGMLLGTLFGQLVCILYLFFTLRVYRYIHIIYFDKQLFFELCKYSIPFIPNTIAWWVFNTSDRVIVSYFLGLSMTGILAAASKFSSVLITIYNMFNITWTESISIHVNDCDIEKYFNDTFEIIIKLFVSLELGIIVCMPFVYPLMINDAYHLGYYLVPILVMSVLFNILTSFTGTVYVAKKNTKEVAMISFISALLNIIIHISLIRILGLYAAAISTLFSLMIVSFYRIYSINRNYFKIKINQKLLRFLIVLNIIVVYCYYLNNVYLEVFMLIFICVTSIIMNKKILRGIYSFIRKKSL